MSFSAILLPIFIIIMYFTYKAEGKRRARIASEKSDAKLAFEQKCLFNKTLMDGVKARSEDVKRAEQEINRLAAHKAMITAALSR